MGRRKRSASDWGGDVIARDGDDTYERLSADVVVALPTETITTPARGTYVPAGAS